MDIKVDEVVSRFTRFSNGKFIPARVEAIIIWATNHSDIVSLVLQEEKIIKVIKYL